MLADNLKQFREQKGFSKLQLARETGVTARTIENIEYKRNINPTYHTLKALANGLGITVEELTK